ncbi:nitrate reductase cytochrome c-type subunit [Thalassotalea maritima]|uniref:nitrate reductase cytochrome c-type subunit n=1 Tax=Thalassotalea maritima TaxID=3242416 RepID=UPI0035285FDC
MKSPKLILLTLGFIGGFFALQGIANEVATLRDFEPIDSQKKPSAIMPMNNSSIKQRRAYPMQPPLIPHQIENYQVDLKVNKCMSCHARNRVEESQATMVSVTHYMDRDGNFLAEISPRRYFCNQCHVPQYENKPLVSNEFVDMHTLIKAKQANQKTEKP